jgi:tetrapyrrole methylase family protein/MazG family protein
MNPPKFTPKAKYNVADLVALMSFLRSPDGCPCDGEQTHKSMRQNLIEEAYEVAEAIDTGDTYALKEELGDLLLQIVFHSSIAGFSMDEIATGVTEKLVSRHPHLFGDTVATDSSQVLDNWERIKREEKSYHNLAEELSGISRSLPALMRGQKICKKLQKAGVGATSAGDSLVDELWELCHRATAQGIDLEQELYFRCDSEINNVEAQG